MTARVYTEKLVSCGQTSGALRHRDHRKSYCRYIIASMLSFIQQFKTYGAAVLET